MDDRIHSTDLEGFLAPTSLNVSGSDMGSINSVLGILRIVRLTRILRVFKASKEMKMMLVLARKYHVLATAKQYSVLADKDQVWLDRLSLLVSTYLLGQAWRRRLLLAVR